MRHSTKKIGDEGEAKACQELERLGYKVIDQNFRTRFGEIDIIAMEGEDLVFIEVKAKSSDYFGTAAEMITKKKIEKIIRTAQDYIFNNELKNSWRIDAVLIDGKEIELIRNLTE